MKWGGYHTEGPLTSKGPQFRFSPRISATSFCKSGKKFFFCRKLHKQNVKGDNFGPRKQNGPPEGARTVVLSFNSTIYLTALSCLLGFINCVSMACRPYAAPDWQWGGGHVPSPVRPWRSHWLEGCVKSCKNAHYPKFHSRNAHVLKCNPKMLPRMHQSQSERLMKSLRHAPHSRKMLARMHGCQFVYLCGCTDTHNGYLGTHRD